MAAKAASADSGARPSDSGTQAEGSAQPGDGTTAAPLVPDGGTQGAEDGEQPGDGPAAPLAPPEDGSTPPDGSTDLDGAAVPDPDATPAAPGGTPAAAPLAPPAPKVAAVTPVPVPAEPNAAVRQAPDGGHIGIVGADGEPLRHDELFTEPEPHHTWMEAARDIFQKFRYPGQHRETLQSSTQLVARKGARIPRDQAHVLIEAARNGAGPAADSEDPGGE
jgi:hypothetical protein